MIISGPCLYKDYTDTDVIMDTASLLHGFATHFRVKCFGGGTSVEKYKQGIGEKGIETLKKLNEIIPTGTEVQTPEHVDQCDGLKYIWIGARNSQNYTLLESACRFDGDLFIKRGHGMTIREFMNLYDICWELNRKNVYLIERGINTFDRQEDSRWSPDLKGVIQIKHERPEVFERLIIDISHSVGKREYIEDTHKAFKAIGIKHWMVECTSDGKSETDSRHMLSVKQVKEMMTKELCPKCILLAEGQIGDCCK